MKAHLIESCPTFLPSHPPTLRQESSVGHIGGVKTPLLFPTRKKKFRRRKIGLHHHLGIPPQKTFFFSHSLLFHFIFSVCYTSLMSREFGESAKKKTPFARISCLLLWVREKEKTFFPPPSPCWGSHEKRIPPLAPRRGIISWSVDTSTRIPEPTRGETDL